MFHDLLEAAQTPLSSWMLMAASPWPTPKPIGCSIPLPTAHRQRDRTLLPPGSGINHIRHRADFLTNPVLRQMAAA